MRGRRPIAILTACLTLLWGVSAFASAAVLSDLPILTVEPGAHVGDISAAGVASQAGIIATASQDKTLRLWKAATGDLLRTIHLPRGPGNWGKAYAVAISPDASVIAVGGWTGSEENTRDVYLFDLTGRMIRKLEGLPENILRLAFSPDGELLAIGLSGGHGVRVHARREGWDRIWSDAGYADDCYGLAFAPDGRLASSSRDGHVRLHAPDGARLGDARLDGPIGLAFSPDGFALAVGTSAPRVLILDARSLKTVAEPDTAGMENGGLSDVAWSPDGKTLYAGGTYQSETSFSYPVVAWAAGGLGARRVIEGAQDTVRAVLPLPDDRLVVVSGDPRIAASGPDGAPLWEQDPRQIEARHQYIDFAVSDDGSQVDFTYDVFEGALARWSAVDLAVTLPAPSDGATVRPVPVEPNGIDFESRPVFNDVALAIAEGERALSHALAPDGRLVLGSDWHLSAFTPQGATLWRRAAPAPVWTTSVTGDGRLAVSVFGDGTIRWHRMEDGIEILAFFPFPDRENWVAWTPDGYYTASPGARGNLRWQVNQGADAAAVAVPVNGEENPEIINRVLAALGTDGLVTQAEKDAHHDRIRVTLGGEFDPRPALHVLSIGVSDYGADAPGLALDYAAQDSVDLVGSLYTNQKASFVVNPNRLTDAEATPAGIFQGFGSIRKRIAEDGRDVVIVHFSGHGAMIDDAFYLIPYGAIDENPYTLRATSFPAAEFNTELQRLAVGSRLIVLVDACRTDITTGTGDRLPADVLGLRRIISAPNVNVFMSASENQASQEGPAWENGAFTESILEALDGAADIDRDGRVDLLEIGKYVETRVPALTEGAQTPTFEIRSSGLALEALR